MCYSHLQNDRSCNVVCKGKKEKAYNRESCICPLKSERLKLAIDFVNTSIRFNGYFTYRIKNTTDNMVIQTNFGDKLL